MQNMSSFIHEGWQWTRTAIWIIVEEFTNILNYKQKPSLMTNYRCLMLPANSKDCHNPAHSLTTKKREKEGEKHEREVDSKESCWFPSSSWGWVIWAPISRDLSTLRENANRVEQRLSLLIWLNSSLSRWNGCLQVKKMKARKEPQKPGGGSDCYSLLTIIKKSLRQANGTPTWVYRRAISLC